MIDATLYLGCPTIIAWGMKGSPEFQRRGQVTTDVIARMGPLRERLVLRGILHVSCDMPNNPLTAHDVLLRWWDATGAGIQTRCVASAEIARLEERYAIMFPSSFRDYLSNASPLEDPSWDNELTNWWPFERLQNVAEGYEHALADEVAIHRDKLVLFADYSIWCWGWAINCAPGPDYGKVAVIPDRAHFVADSFDQFVAKYIGDLNSVCA